MQVKTIDKSSTLDKTYDSLTILEIEGHDHSPADDEDLFTLIPRGEPYWLISRFTRLHTNPDGRGLILWSDLDEPRNLGGHRFSLLLETTHVNELREFCEENDYAVTKTRTLTDSLFYGDHGGKVLIGKHNDLGKKGSFVYSVTPVLSIYK